MKSTEYKNGFPKDRGLYRVTVDGKETILVHHFCVNNCKHWWTDTRGFDVVGHEIKFSGEKLNVEDI